MIQISIKMIRGKISMRNNKIKIMSHKLIFNNLEKMNY